MDFTGFFKFAFATPISSLVTVIMLIIAYAVLTFRKGVKDDLADFKVEITDVKTDFVARTANVSKDVDKIKASEANLVGEIQGTKMRLGELSGELQEYKKERVIEKADQVKRLIQYEAITERFNSGVKKLMEVHSKLEKSAEENKIINENYGRVLESIADLKKKKQP